MSATITYRKTKAGEWVTYGPAAAFGTSGWVTVTRRDGTTRTEAISRLGRPFLKDGVEMCYGYIDRDGKREYAQAKAEQPQDGSAGPRCSSCRCHREARAGQPGTTLYDGCDRCGCEAA